VSRAPVLSYGLKVLATMSKRHSSPRIYKRTFPRDFFFRLRSAERLRKAAPTSLFAFRTFFWYRGYSASRPVPESSVYPWDAGRLTNFRYSDRANIPASEGVPLRYLIEFSCCFDESTRGTQKTALPHFQTWSSTTRSRFQQTFLSLLSSHLAWPLTLE